MSEKKGGDPFEGLDWDKELDDWDKSTSAPGAVAVPESFSQPPPPTRKEEPSVPVPAAAAQKGVAPRPLYRPPVAPASPPRPPAQTPAAGRPAADLHSLIDEADEDERDTRARRQQDDDDDSESTVVAPVSRDLLAELEKAGIQRRERPKKKPQPLDEPSSSRRNEPTARSTDAVAPPVEIDLLGLDEGTAEPTADHPPPEPEDPSVVTSAPDFLQKIRGVGRAQTHEAMPRQQADHPVREGEMFDPFKGMDVEPPASETVGKKPVSTAPGPKLLAPEKRKHSDSDETAIFDKKALKPSVPAKLDADATVETVDPFGSSDPFATPPPQQPPLEQLRRTADLFAPRSSGEEPLSTDTVETEVSASEEPLDGGLIDLLRGEETSSDALPATAELAHPPIERAASDYVAASLDLWRARSERVANDARSYDKSQKARGLVVASELAAIAGDRAHAIELAEEAWEASPGDALAIRQLRQLLAAEGRWDDVAPLLESEAKGNGPAAAKAHASILAADAARLARAAPDEATKLYEGAQRVSNNDVRPMIARALSALSAGKSMPLIRWPQGVGAEPLAEAIMRRAKGGEALEDTSLATLIEGIATFPDGKAGVEGPLAQALDELAGSPTIGAGARWVRLALDASRVRGRAGALELVAELPAGRSSSEATLALSLDLGDIDHALIAARRLAHEHPEPETQIALQALQAMSPHEPPSSASALSPHGSEPGVNALGRALAIAGAQDPPAEFASVDSLDAATRVAGRFLAGTAIEPELRGRTSRGAQLGFALADAIGGGGPRATLDALAKIVSWPADSAADESMARVLTELAEGDSEGARIAAQQALAADPTSLPAVYALLSLGDEEAPAAAMAAAESAADDGRATALSLQVALAALRRNDFEMAKRGADLALMRAPDDAVASFVSELRARRAGDFDGVIESVRARAKGTADPMARTANLVREIFLLLGSDLATCIERASEAAQLMPKDPTVRALYERIAGEGAQGRADWRGEIAATLEGPAKGETLLDAAREAERHGDLDAAEKYAVAAEAAGVGAEAKTLRHRVQSRGDGAARLAEELLDVAKNAETPSSQREAYESLADLDLFARNDAASATLWHRAILESTPGHLPSLRRLEHMLVGAGREEDYESVASELARTLPADGRDAHAEVAARLRLRRPEAVWDSISDLVALATEREIPSIWATRMLDAAARPRNDDAALLRVNELLLARADRPTEIAALATRAAEASFRLGDIERARGYLERALEAEPQHPTALASLAELRRHAGDVRGAAEAIEAMAQTQLVPEHRLEDWHAAAVLWLDRVGDVVRGRAALERAAEIDFGYGDVFERLVSLARDSKETAVVADLYARRLQQLDDPAARAALQVDYARVLVELSDRESARSALSDALDVAPGNVEALNMGSRLAEEAEDWPDLESYLLRLAKALDDPGAKIAIYRRLGAVYEGPYPDDRKAEGIYRRILQEHEDDDIYKRLVDVYVRIGDGDQAVETHQERVRLASDPAQRRARLIELAKLLDEVADDPTRALQALEQARAGDPADLTALAALAEFHGKHGRPELVAPALDAAASDLRRKLEGDAGNIGLLQTLGQIVELRGRGDAVAAVHAVLAGLRGEPGQLIPAEDAASIADLDPLLCPPELGPSIRALLTKAGDALEKSVPVDLRALKAAKLGTSNPVLKAKIDAVARGFGLPDPDVVISRAMPFLCLPVGAKPFQIVIGEGIVSTEEDVARRFVLYRAMKACSAHCAALIRVPPGDLKVYLDVLLHHLHPEHPAPEIEAERLDEITKRLQRFIPRKDEAELRTLAAAVVAEGVPSTEALASAAATWGDRVALLAVADVGAALKGVAWTLGQRDAPPPGVEARRAWLAANPAARDLVAFSLSDIYLEARSRAGVGPGG